MTFLFIELIELKSDRRDFLLQAETFVHQALEARFIKNVVGEFFVGKHG